MCLIFLIIIFIFIQPAYIGPGGIVTKALLKSLWCKAALALMAITCLPLASLRHHNAQFGILIILFFTWDTCIFGLFKVISILSIFFVCATPYLK
jgi:hypothetical protein